MPGLLRGLARTAAVAGTATAVSNRVSRRQGGRWARKEQEEAEAEPEQAAAAPPPDRLAQLKQLGELRDQDVLTEAEFQQQKAQILNS
jgi:putative oligomerization/nucleic acid binding protein